MTKESTLVEKTEKKLKGHEKTIDITNKRFMNRLNPAFTELANLPSNADSGQLKYAIKRSLGGFQDAVDRYSKKRREIFEDRCKKDKDGNPEFGNKEEYLFEGKDEREEAFKLIEELDDEVIKLTLYSITLENVLKATKTISIGLELSLEGFLEELVDKEDAKKPIK